ncbi:MAG: aminoacyl-tRNA hydrolase [Clostridiales bacterium]|jgi:PTH1 family peptidyl-tRNA hydrolase|nr:aminoacyl-tRNA hydrolase [Clostridiales bacterium]
MFFGKFKSSPIDFLIVGLGNPGKKYAATRHNAGFMAVEALAEKLGVKLDRVKFRAFCGKGRIGDRHVLLMMPQTYMNLSGEAVVQAMRFYKLKPKQVLVIFDDTSLPVGAVRIRRKGSDGGQKGMRSIISLSGSEEFPRIKIGIGEKPRPEYDLSDWVLSRFTKEELQKVAEAVDNAAQAACMIVQDDIDGAMNLYSK